MSNKKYSVAIVGASGYTGSELARILLSHPEVEIRVITSETHKGKKFSDLHPQFNGLLDLTLTSASEVEKIGAHLIFLALPHGVSMEFVRKWSHLDSRIIDLSGDFRLGGAEIYKKWYLKDHSFPEGFVKAIYGLPEIYPNEIRNSHLTANPGCYPTASILSLAPLCKSGLIHPGSIIIDAKSGTTGAGIKPGETSHFSNVNDNFRAYGMGSHRHTIEIEEQFENLSNEKITLQFTPHLLPVDRGILATSYAQITIGESMDQEKLDRLYHNFYQDKPFVRLRKKLPSIKEVRGSNFCDICPFWDERTKCVISVAVIDNLVKGAAGQAIQNMNLMLGLDQTTGLLQAPIQP